MEFTKMHAAGNDFIIINNMEEKIPVEKLGDLAETLCERRLSIGADGLMVVDYPEYGGDYKMRFYNADGSFGEMCGNGARCLARYGYENELAGELQKIETIAGMVVSRRKDENMYCVRLNDVAVMKDMTVTALDKEYRCTYVELGDPGIPHAAVNIPGLRAIDKEDLRELGRTLRYCDKFPKGANVNFYEITGEDKVAVLTYERGVEDFTLACGTGTGSVVAVLAAKKLVSGKDVEVKVPGGELFVSVSDDGLFLTGPTAVVAKGYINTKDLHL